MATDLERWQSAYDQLFHRARAVTPDITRGIPTPHELRTGQAPDAVEAAVLGRRRAREARA